MMETADKTTGMASSNARSEAQMEAAYADVARRYPAHAGTVSLDRLRATQYSCLDEFRQVYLDYTGGSLHVESQLEEHLNGHSMVRIYGPATIEARGGTVTLNLYDPQGHLPEYRRLEELAGQEGISLRTGRFCNPGAGKQPRD